MFNGFRDFVVRGNVIDLAVAVVIGAAFSAVVNAIASGLITPLVRILLGGSTDTIGGQVTINGQVLDFALVINAVITFLITAAVVYFVFVWPMNTYRERKASGAPTAIELDAEEVVLLREIRDLLRQREFGGAVDGGTPRDLAALAGIGNTPASSGFDRY